MSKTAKTDTDQQPFWQMAIETWQSNVLSIRTLCKQVAKDFYDKGNNTKSNQNE